MFEESFFVCGWVFGFFRVSLAAFRLQVKVNQIRFFLNSKSDRESDLFQFGLGPLPNVVQIGYSSDLSLDSQIGVHTALTSLLTVICSQMTFFLLKSSWVVLHRLATFSG